MDNAIQSILKEFSLVILDGAFSTELERRGCNINDELWSAKILMEQPDMIGKVHADYFAAGADVAITASYQATIEGFMRRGMTKEEALSLIRLSVDIAKKERDEFWEHSENRKNRPKPVVAASVGPYGAFLADGSEYRGHYKIDESELRDFHAPRLKALIEAKPDILACETLPCLAEAKAIVAVLQGYPHMSAWISFSAKDEEHISNGEKILDCAAWLDQQDQIAAIGINCTAPQYVKSLIEIIRSQTNKPILVYPNSGEQYDAATKDWHGASAENSFADYTKQWYKAGARAIGGCCRTTPDDIRAIAKWARSK